MLSNQAMRSEMIERILTDLLKAQEDLGVLVHLDDERDINDQIKTIGDGIDKAWEGTLRAQVINDNSVID